MLGADGDDCASTENAAGGSPSSPPAGSSPLPGTVTSGSSGAATPPPPPRSSEGSVSSSSAAPATARSPSDTGSGLSSSPQTITELSPTSVSPSAYPDARSESEPAADLSVGINTSLFGNPYPFGPPPTDSSAGGSSAADQQSGMGFSPTMPVIPEHLRNQRRPSLPIIVSPPGAQTAHYLSQGIPPHQQRVSSLSLMQHAGHLRTDSGGNPLDPTIRRRSVDTNMTRLGVHPYAHLAANPNGSYPGDVNFLRRGSMPHILDPQMMNGNGMGPRPGGMLNTQGHGQFVRRPAMFSRMSMPAMMHMQEENAVFEESPPRISQAFMGNQAMPHLTQYHGSQANGGMFAIPQREIPPPIAGPLPSPGFSFGDAPSSSGGESLPSSGTSSSPSLATPSSSGSIGPHPSMLMHARRSLSGPAEDPDTEDDASAISSNYPFSRFGSIASVAGSESSFTSGGCWSEAGSKPGLQSHRSSEGQLQVDNVPVNGFERRPR